MYPKSLCVQIYFSVGPLRAVICSVHELGLTLGLGLGLELVIGLGLGLGLEVRVRG